MRNLSGNQIREEFLRFFETKLHRRVHSSSLVPANDPTLLFTNAGMNQFKDVFLGAERRDYSRAATSQKCVRAGGKHNDLENVGFTRRHQTFFEMLGNFSFGDYFKRDAISFAWELLTDPAWFALDKSRLYVTIFDGTGVHGLDTGEDEEARKLWIETGVSPDRIFGMPGKDNFWQMGETGPCGPCSEIFYDMGIEASETGEDKPFPQDDQRYVEIWNLVFMQFDRSPGGPKREDGTSPQFAFNLLPKPSIDTGMGLERLSTVLQGKLSNYESDLFTPLIAAAAQLTNFRHVPDRHEIKDCHAERSEGPASPPSTDVSSRPEALSERSESKGRSGETRLSTPATTLSASTIAALAVSDDKPAASLRIIADHARASTFLISDGVNPSNEGRGYVLRKILRRGIRHGRLLGQEKPFMHQMVYAVRDEMQAAYPELKESADRVAKVVLAEEQQFARVMELGSKQLDNLIAQKRAVSSAPQAMAGENVLQAIATTAVRGIVLGTEAFRLYETFGLPEDFIADAVRDAGLIFDADGFRIAKEEEQARARASWRGGSQKTAAPVYRELPKTEFEGYQALRVDGAKVIALVKDGVGVQSLNPGETGEVVLDATSFYADSGGQVGDIGWLYASDHHTIVAEVIGCKKPVQAVFAHQVIARQTIALNDTVDTAVNGEVRSAVMRNHTGTHLLHAALRQVLGTHVKQAGSLNDPNRLRFDFSHFTGVAEEELAEIESIVNAQILKNSTVQTFVDVPIDEAVHEYGAMALFGEKYGDKVRVVKIGDFSTELCGGTHTSATGEIGLLKLVGEGAVASGVRRVEAVSGAGALNLFRRDADVAKVAAQFVGGSDLSADSLRARVNAQDEEMKKLRRELEQMRMKSASAATADAASSAVEVKGIKVLAQRVDALGGSQEAKSQMRNLVDELRGKLGSGVVILGAAGEGKVALIVGVTKDLTSRLQAGKIVGALAAKVGGKGGGRPDLAEAGGTDPSSLDATLHSAKELIADLLG